MNIYTRSYVVVKSQQQETIRTELIPGHRGNLDVDELVMFIDGNPSKQRQNSSLLNSTDASKAKLNTLNDSSSNKTAPRKKSRKTTKSLQQSISVTDDHENETSTSVTLNQSHSETNYVDDENNLTKHSIVDITNQLLEDRTVSTANNNEYRSDITNTTPVPMTVRKMLFIFHFKMIFISCRTVSVHYRIGLSKLVIYLRQTTIAIRFICHLR